MSAFATAVGPKTDPTASAVPAITAATPLRHGRVFIDVTNSSNARPDYVSTFYLPERSSVDVPRHAR